MTGARQSRTAMKKMLSSLHSRVKGSGCPCPSLMRSRCPPMEQSSCSLRSPLHVCTHHMHQRPEPLHSGMPANAA